MKKPFPFTIGSEIWNGLVKVQEELGELQVELAKLQAIEGDIDNYWGDHDLRKAIEDEIADVLGSIRFFLLKNGHEFDMKRMAARETAKINKYLKWDRGIRLEGVPKEELF